MQHACSHARVMVWPRGWAITTTATRKTILLVESFGNPLQQWMVRLQVLRQARLQVQLQPIQDPVQASLEVKAPGRSFSWSHPSCPSSPPSPSPLSASCPASSRDGRCSRQELPALSVYCWLLLNKIAGQTAHDASTTSSSVSSWRLAKLFSHGSERNSYQIAMDPTPSVASGPPKPFSLRPIQEVPESPAPALAGLHLRGLHLCSKCSRQAAPGKGGCISTCRA